MLFKPKPSERVLRVDIGDRSEQHLIARLMSAGYNVLKPVSHASRYDLVIEDADYRFHRIQCKTGRYKNGVIEFHCMKSAFGQRAGSGVTYKTHLYTANEVDYYAVWCPALAKAYIIPFADAPEKLCKLRVDEPKNGHRGTENPRGIRWAADYEL